MVVADVSGGAIDGLMSAVLPWRRGCIGFTNPPKDQGLGVLWRRGNSSI